MNSKLLGKCLPALTRGSLLIGMLAALLSPISVLAAPLPLQTAEEAAPKQPLAASTGDLVIQALSMLNVPYRYGGNSPITGMDCSGMVRYVVGAALGLDLPRRSQEISHVGAQVGKDDLQPGDLVFFNTLRRAYSHVAIYLGNNRFVHAPSRGGKVRIDSITDRYWTRRFDGARRLTPEPAASDIQSAATTTASIPETRNSGSVPEHSPLPEAVQSAGS